MSSYASEVKKELTTLEVHREHARAELEALIRMNGSLSIFNHQFILNVQTENPAIARRMYTLLKQNYAVESELIVRRKMKLKKNNLYIVRLKQGTNKVLNDLHILDGISTLSTLPSLEVLNSEQKIRSYLRGAFLAGGSVNNPETSRYHLEIYSLYEEHNQKVAAMINQFGLNARTTERRGGFIVYLKEAEKIADFLQLIGATNAMLKFEDIRIVRDMRNSVNRLVNCETANLNKTIDAATRQVENIKYISAVAGLDSLPAKLQEIAVLRLGNPDITLKELGEMVPSGAISKSGINHRLRKLNEVADNLRQGRAVS
ncbi:DNA-binding protein WhiA [Loigolactobacillus backii]|uniref:Probable cell division protein WhiA n=1 Tax=Loigolactobacillus backii TaxID=375175 RepID=A0A192H4J6_9LACO|nr:DNA-binding protein WhiA [Loigolactobacillus backii]ANK63300.1 sporulation regulator WhiA [Loigolactobacillus backii]ANK64899.1 sporulation regulator WhiA [Loigolactobacillus backii]ANK66654.1 sporulation regulator WhiA [Loigolactobacillus backii]ANK69695.1 sporulation regulator WhiA [Loigolactobacillus backii]MDA5386594.1 DNA-binding protein WhiA [Loigolactobacillus backii]